MAREVVVREALRLRYLSAQQIEGARASGQDFLPALSRLLSPEQLQVLRQIHTAAMKGEAETLLPKVASGHYGAVQPLEAGGEVLPFPQRGVLQAGGATLPPAGDVTLPMPGAATVPPIGPTAASPGGYEETLPHGPSIPAQGSPEQIGPYVVVKELARGGMGVVYVAQSPSLERRVALKVLLAGTAADDAAIDRFKLEAKAMARLQHPNVVGVHEVGLDQQGRWFMAMDLVDGGSLSARIKEEGRLGPRLAANWARSIALALAAAHAQEVLHRDLKPANILLDTQAADAGGARPRITDFGLAKIAGGEGMTATGQSMGTPAYMPPEQADGDLERIDARSDVYSLGATLYEMLCGEPPFKGATALNVINAVLTREPTPLTARGVDLDLATICHKCLEKEPEDRYDSAQSLADDLGRYLVDEPILARPPSLGIRARKWIRRNRVVAGATAVLALGGLVGVLLLVQERQRGEQGVAAARDEGIDEERTRRAAADRAAEVATLARFNEVFDHIEADPAAQAQAARAGVALALERPEGIRELLHSRLQARAQWLEERELGVLGRAPGAQPKALKAAMASRARRPLSAPPELLSTTAVALESVRGALPAREQVARAQFDASKSRQATLAYRVLRAIPPTKGEAQLLARCLVAEARVSPAVEVALALVMRDTGLERALGEVRVRPGSFERRVYLGLRAFPEDRWPETARSWGVRAGVAQAWGELETAREVSAKAIALDPNDANLQVLKARIALMSKDLERAASAVERARKLDPGSPEVSLVQVELSLAQDDLIGAERVLVELLKSTPRVRFRALLLQARRENQAGLSPAAFTLTAKAIRSAPQEAAGWALRARLRVAQAAENLADLSGGGQARQTVLDLTTSDFREACLREPEDPAREVEFGEWLMSASPHAAMQAFARAEALDPKNPRWTTLRGDQLLQVGREQEAAALAREVLRRSPRAASAWRLLALSLRKPAAKEERWQAHQNSCDFAPKAPMNRVLFAKFLLHYGHKEEALEQADLALQTTPGFRLALTMRAEIRLQTNAPRAALEDAREVVRAGGRYAHLGLRLEGRALGALGDHRRALARLEQSLALKQDAKTLVEAGRAARALGLLAQAEGFWTAATRHDGDETALVRLAELFLIDERPQEALRATRAANELARDSATVLNVRWQVHLALKQRDLALRDLRALIRASPGNHPLLPQLRQAEAALARGEEMVARPPKREPLPLLELEGAGSTDLKVVNGLLRKGDARRALKALASLAARFPQEPNIQVAVARCHARSKASGKKVILALRVALEAEPNHVDALLLLAKSTKDPALALRCLNTAIRANPERADVWECLGAFHERRPSVALGHLNRALKINPQLGKARRLRGMVHYRRSAFEEAKADLMAATKIDPYDAEAWLMLAFLEQGRERLDRALKLVNHTLDLPGAPRHAIGLRCVVRAALDQRAGARADLHRARRVLPPQSPLLGQAENAVRAAELRATGD
jgi:tetratricopeptide (TPR) repeat protein